jgi:hypothetical protein
MRTLVALLFVSTIAQAAIVNEAIDLTAPGALQSLQQRKPEHYAKVQAILAIAEAPPRPDLARFIETQFEVSDVDMLAWRVSYPAKLQVSFTLDHTRYTALVVPRVVARPTPTPLR